jgi:hypothetical protein
MKKHDESIDAEDKKQCEDKRHDKHGSHNRWTQFQTIAPMTK